MILKILATILTGIGGHYLNRRWDKAILFMCLFFLYWIAVYIFSIFSYQNIALSSDGFVQELNDIAKRTTIITAIGIVIIWGISIAVTIMDSIRNADLIIFKWTKSGVAGGILTSFFSFALLAATAGMLITINQNVIANSESITIDTEVPTYRDHNFYESIYFGGSPSNPFKLPPAPKGKGVLKGRITYKNNPANGVTLSVVLNSKYQAKDIITDSKGVFVIELPIGTWTINSIQTEKWENKPEEGSFTMYYGGEEKFSAGKYHRHGFMQRTGYPVIINATQNIPHLNITINDDIEMLYPDPKSKAVNATIDGAINWKEHPGADRYYIDIKKVTRKGRTTHYRSTASRVVSGGTSIPLASFKHIKTKNREKAEYSVNLYAFSENGTLIAESATTYQGGTLFLTDGNVFIEEDLDDQFDLSDIQDPEKFAEIMEAISHEEDRASAVDILISDDLLEEAESLLRIMNSEYAKGRKEVLSGYINALRGECEKANEQFENASSINPNVCIPDRYRKKCI